MDNYNRTENTALSGVCCEVDKCAYNNGCGCCTAHDIHVKTKMAMLGAQTECATFTESDK